MRLWIKLQVMLEWIVQGVPPCVPASSQVENVWWLHEISAKVAYVLSFCTSVLYLTTIRTASRLHEDPKRNCTSIGGISTCGLSSEIEF